MRPPSARYVQKAVYEVHGRQVCAIHQVTRGSDAHFGVGVYLLIRCAPHEVQMGAEVVVRADAQLARLIHCPHLGLHLERQFHFDFKIRVGAVQIKSVSERSVLNLEPARYATDSNQCRSRTI